MTNTLEEKIKEILKLVKLCPLPLQERCFEILLTDTLSKNTKTNAPKQEEGGENRVVDSGINPTDDQEISKRAKAFAASHDLQLPQLQSVFGFDDMGVVTIEVADLKVKKTSQLQRRLALLIGVRHQFMEGKFDVPVEELREMCVTYGCYDPANFLANLKNAKSIFAGYKTTGTNRLSPVGKKEAGVLVGELASHD